MWLNVFVNSWGWFIFVSVMLVFKNKIFDKNIFVIVCWLIVVGKLIFFYSIKIKRIKKFVKYKILVGLIKVMVLLFNWLKLFDWVNIGIVIKLLKKW